MEVAGIGLAVIAEARSIVISIQTRIAQVKQAAETCRVLTENLDRLMRHIGEVERVLQNSPNVIPPGIALVFNETLTSVRDTLLSCNSTMADVCAKVFPSSRSVRAKLKSMVRRTVQITALNEAISSVQDQVKDASNQLLHLVSMLATAMKIDTREKANSPSTPDAVYHPEASAPALPHTVNLDFDAKNATGEPGTPEAVLKFSILSTTSSTTVAAASGVMNPAYGVVGMAGVGKSIALQGLAKDEDIRKRFVDGIHYMSLGQGATVRIITEEICRIMSLTGAHTTAETVEKCSTLRDVVDLAVGWFTGRICLFLVDDLWPTDNCKTGYLSDLRQLLRESPESRMAISTRSVAIAHAAGFIVDFGARDPPGSVSLGIFMTHATGSVASDAYGQQASALSKSLSTILSICGGLPIALSVAGCSVALLVREHGDFDSACDAYAVQLGKQRADLGDEQGPEGTSLSAGILLSLHILEAEYLKLKNRNFPDVEYTISELYTSLCVLGHQAWVPISVLSRMWNIDEDSALAAVRLLCGLSLATLHYRRIESAGRKEAGVVLHDLHLDFCKRQAAKKRTSCLWHSKLLNGYLERPSDAVATVGPTDATDLFVRKLLAFEPRPWWSAAVPNDSYIHRNLCRHLFSANCGLELAAVLLDARWTHTRAHVGGILDLRADFETLLRQQMLPEDVKLSFEYILKAVHLSRGRIPEGLRSFQFQLCGRLLKLRTRWKCVNAYLLSIEGHTPMPYLVPVNSFFPDLRTAQILEIPVGSECFAVSRSACERYIAVGADCDVVVVNETTGDPMRRLKGHSKFVTCLSFTADSKRIISGSRDKTVMIWDWEASESPVVVLPHNCAVKGISVCRDGGRIFSACLDSTLKVWDANSGKQEEEFRQQRSVHSVAVCPDDRFIGFGLQNGTLAVLNRCTGEHVFEDIQAHKNVVTCVTFSANGRRLATGSCDKSVRVWNTDTWTGIGARFEGHEKAVESVAFSPDGQQIVSGSHDGTVCLWDVDNGRRIWTSSKLLCHVRGVAFTRNGERVISASGDGTLRIWDTRLTQEGGERSEAQTRVVHSFAMSHDGMRVATGYKDGYVRLWDCRSGEHIAAGSTGRRAVKHVAALSPDGRHVVLGSWTREPWMYWPKAITESGDIMERHARGARCASFSADGHRIITGSFDKTVRTWDAKSSKQIGDPLEGHTKQPRGVSESHDGRYIVSRDQNRDTFIWNRTTRVIVWKSEEQNINTNEITDELAKKIIVNCGQETPVLWPKLFPSYKGEVWCTNSAVYSIVNGEKTLLATFPSSIQHKRYSASGRVLFVAFQRGGAAICNLRV